VSFANILEKLCKFNATYRIFIPDILDRNNYWPEAKFAALGAFIFLRFISPAIVSPDIVDVELPKENRETVRKGLKVIAKIIQHLANNVFFGKEAHMTSLNKFLEENIVNVTRFLSELNVS
jgi:hypothetical protein